MLSYCGSPALDSKAVAETRTLMSATVPQPFGWNLLSFSDILTIMPTIEECGLLQAQYQEILRLETECTAALEEAKGTGDKRKMRETKTAYLEGIKALREKLWPFVELTRERLKQCYQDQVFSFEKANVFEEGTRSIKGIDDKIYPMPSIAEVERRLREKREMVEQKVAQGLTRIQLRPIAAPMDTLRARYREALLRHHGEGKPFAPKENPTDPDEVLDLDIATPVWVWDQYEGADVSNKVVYFPKRFDPVNHEGKTKMEVIAEVGGWQIILTEDKPNLAAKGKGKTKGGRKELEADKSATEYLELLSTNPMYQHEEGFITEDWLTYAIIELETKNQVLDDWQGKGKISRNVGQYFPASGHVPNAYWDRDFRQARLSRGDAGGRDVSIGARSAVRV